MNAVIALCLFAAAPDYGDEISAALADTARVFPIPASLVRAIITVESGFDPTVRSAAGAIGLMQVMPFNAKKLGLSSAEQLWEPRLNILAGVRLLAVLFRHYDGDVVACLVAYNAGPRPKRSPIPKNGETPGYVENVLRVWRQLEAVPPQH